MKANQIVKEIFKLRDQSSIKPEMERFEFFPTSFCFLLIFCKVRKMVVYLVESSSITWYYTVSPRLGDLVLHSIT